MDQRTDTAAGASNMTGDHADFSSYARGITEEEVAPFWKNGWVRVNGFVDPSLCEQVTARYINTDGLGLVPYQPFYHVNFPTVYP